MTARACMLPLAADRDADSDLVCIWPLHTPPTQEDLERIYDASNNLQRMLTAVEVLALIPPQGRA